MEKEVRLIQSIQRAFDIINCFSEQSPKISEMLSLNINTTRGIVNTLVANGYLEHDSETNIYSLGPVFIPKADLVSANDMERVKKMARPYLEELSNTFQVSARLQVVSNYNIFTIENINPENAHYILLTRLNTTFALNATASGKLLLYYMGERQRERYFKTLDQRMYTKNTLVTREDLQKELAAQTAAMYVYDNIFGFNKAGLGQAAAIIITVVLVILTYAITAVCNRLEVEE